MPALDSIQTLFTSGEVCREPMRFHWRLIRRKGHPFLLLPLQHSAARAGLGLYSAQRAIAKAGRIILRQGVGAPLMRMLPRFSLEVDGAAEFMKFLRNQAGHSDPQVPPTVLFSARAAEKQRFVMLVCDNDKQPVRIVKVGLRPRAHAVIEREADFISTLPGHPRSAVDIIDRLSTPVLSAFAMPFFKGENPQSDEGVEPVLLSWLNAEAPMPLENLPSWQELALAGAGSEKFQAVGKLLAGSVVRSTISHGDFAPWNIRVNSLGEWKVYDWELGDLKGVPGWDWFHFVVQRLILVQRHSPEFVAATLEKFVASERFRKYAVAAGIEAIIKPLLLAYLLRQQLVIRPEQGAEPTGVVYELLAERWLQSRASSKNKLQSAGPLESVGNTARFVKTRRTALQAEMVRWVETFREVLSLFQSEEESLCPRRSLWVLFRTHWPTITSCYLIFAILAVVHSFAGPRFTFLPFYLIPCGVLTLVINRRWAMFAALVSSPIGPALLSKTDDDFSGYSLLFWNSLMRFVLFCFFILLLDRVRLGRRNVGT